MKKILPLLVGISLGSITTAVNAEDLLQVYQQAKQYDATILQAAATREAAFSAIDSSRATLLPQINLSAGYNLSRNSEASSTGVYNNTNTLSAGISLNQQLFNRASWINLESSEIKARQADAVYAAAQQTLILRVADAYFGVLRSMDNLEFVKAEKKAVARQLEQTKQRFQVGLSAITDVHDAQAQYDSVLAQEILAQNALANSYESVREITGQEYTTLNQLNTKTFSAVRPRLSVEALVKQAEQENLSLLASRIAKDAAKLNINLAKTGHLPTLSLNADYDYLDQDNKTLSERDKKFRELSGGINLSLPIYSGGSVNAQIDQAKFGYVASSEAYAGVFRSTSKNVRAFYNNVNASIGSLRAFGQTVVSARSALEATEAGFEVGTRTIVDVLDATRRLYDANRNLADARYDYIINEFQLRQAIGTLNEQDVIDINQGLKS